MSFGTAYKHGDLQPKKEHSSPQKPPAISQPSDSYEQEANRMASHVADPDPDASPLPRPIATGGIHHSSGSQKQLADLDMENDPATQITIKSGGSGSPLDYPTREFMESRFNFDFSKVRIHTGKQADEITIKMNASALTIGNNIAFAAGYYDPYTAAGSTLLAHELTHVVQQSKMPDRSGPVGASFQHPTFFRKTKGEEVMDRAQGYLTVDAEVKRHVDVLKAAIREIKSNKSVEYNKAAGITRIEELAKLLNISETNKNELIEQWKEFARTKTLNEATFLANFTSPLAKISKSYPKSQVKYWLKNTPAKVVDAVYAAADADLPAIELWVYASAEGLVDYTRDQIGLSGSAEPTSSQLGAVRTDQSIHGFNYLGLDDFMTDMTAAKHPLTEFLPPSFDRSKLTPADSVNEQGRTVHSATFPDLTMALKGMAASLKRRRTLFREDAKAHGYADPTTEELVYWTYVYYNAGEFAGKKSLSDHSGKRKLSDWITLGKYPNAIKVIDSYKMTKDLAIF